MDVLFANAIFFAVYYSNRRLLLLHSSSSSMGCRKWRLFVFFLFLINLHTHVFVDAQICSDGNFTANSVYQSNRDSLLSLLPLSIGNSGFFNSSAGQNSDRVNAIAFCRADMQLEECRNCIGNGTLEIGRACPLSRGTIAFREPCFVRVSNGSIAGVLSENPGVTARNLQNASNVQQFISDLRSLLDILRPQAAGGGLLKVAADNRTGPDFLNIYSLVQCTPDISADDCDRCLSNAAQQIPVYGSIGFRIELPSCRLYYDVFRFFNVSRIQEVRALIAPPPPSPSPSPTTAPTQPVRGISTTIIIVIAVVAAVAGCIFLATCAVIIFRRKQMIKQRRPRETNDYEDDEEISTAESLQYDFNKIRAATDDFSGTNELGRGGFGVVYKGKLENGKEIAVKRLSRVSAQGDMKFKNEVLVMAKLQHKNLLKLYGFAIQGSERLLICEYLQNSSLDRFISDPVKRSELDWDKRYKIIGGIARGLLYLHEDSRFRIIHRDLKPSNVLLDREMNPKIADFGQARLFDGDEGSTSKVAGTYGYMPPEYAYRGLLSIKIDVYSFGVLILELISGQLISSFMNAGRVADMLSFAWRNWQEGSAENLIDPVVRVGTGSLPDMLRCIHIGLLCVQENAGDRPTMASVVLMLNSSSITMDLPSRPPFFMPQSTSTDLTARESELTESTETAADVHVAPSVNDVTITALFPR